MRRRVFLCNGFMASIMSWFGISFKQDEDALFNKKALSKKLPWGKSILNDSEISLYRAIHKNRHGERSWLKKDYYDIIHDINRAITEVETCGLFRKILAPICMNLPTPKRYRVGIASCRASSLLKTNEYGQSVMSYFKHYYPNSEIFIIPEFSDYCGKNLFMVVTDENKHFQSARYYGI